MADFPFDIVGFDLDGTLLDTSGDLTAAVNHTLALAGKPLLTTDEVKPMIGGGAKMMLEHGLKAAGGIAEDEFRPLYRAMMAYYTENISVHTRPFPGAVALLDHQRMELVQAPKRAAVFVFIVSQRLQEPHYGESALVPDGVAHSLKRGRNEWRGCDPMARRETNSLHPPSPDAPEAPEAQKTKAAGHRLPPPGSALQTRVSQLSFSSPLCICQGPCRTCPCTPRGQK